MKIRVKVKHLALALAAACAVALALFFVGIPELQVRLAERQYAQGVPGGKANLLAAIDEAGGKRKWELIREHLIETTPDSPAYGYDVYVGPGFTQTRGGATSEGGEESFRWEEKRPYLEAYVREGPADGYLIRAARQLAFHEGSEGRREQALAALELAERRLGDGWESERLALLLERAKLQAESGRTAEAEALLGELPDPLPAGRFELSAEAAMLRVKLRLSEGDLDGAYELASREREAYRQSWEAEKERLGGAGAGGGTPVRLEQLEALCVLLRRALDAGGVSAVAGTVRRSDGAPLAGVGVYLRDSGAVFRSVTEGEPYQTVTDAQGRYRFDGVVPGSYQLQIGVRFEQIDGWTWSVEPGDWLDIRAGERRTAEDIVLRPLLDLVAPADQQVVTGEAVRFEWEPVDGAAYYRLNASVPTEDGAVGSVIVPRVRGTSVLLPVEALYDQPLGLTFRTAGDRQSILPSTVLGFAHPGSRFSWSVEAFDDAGRLLTRSNGYRLNETTMGKLPFFYLRARELTEADRLLEAGRLDEAMAAYKEAYERNPQDLHSLRMIIRLYDAEAAVLGEREPADGKLPYLLAMAEANPVEPYLFQLFEHYKSRKDWPKVDEYYARLERLRPEGPGSYAEASYAEALMRQGKLTEARALYEQAVRDDPDHRFVGPYLALALAAAGSPDAVVADAERYPERGYPPTDPDWAALVRALSDEARAGGDAYLAELLEKLSLYFRGDRAALDERDGSGGRPAMKAFLQALFDVD